jgi:hypothetical protein
MLDDKPTTPPDAPESPPPSKPAASDEYEDVDAYTAEMACKCGKQLAANAWFCPRCGRIFLLNMLFALVVLGTSFALMTHLVTWLLSFFATHKPQ